MADSDTTQQQVDVEKLIAEAILADREALLAELEAKLADRAKQANRKAESLFTAAQWVGVISIIASFVRF